MNFYEEFYDDSPISEEEYKLLKSNQKRTRAAHKARDIRNEVGLVPPITDEIKELREYYSNNYVAMHSEVFTNSTGIKPFGENQERSIRQTQSILTYGGRAVIAEPRGFAKTSRTTNNALAAILQGKIRYVLILASSVTKATEILEAIKTELISNEKLQELYPAVCACFEQAEERGSRVKNQTYGGNPTYLDYRVDRIRFPSIDGEASSGSVIHVKSKDNVRGLSTKVRYGPDRGKVLRPDFVFLDDIQTDEEAESEVSAAKIIRTIKKSILYAGSHHKKISAIMCCTPIVPGDVSTHFILNEPSWEVTLYKMVEEMPDNLEVWLTEYADIYMDFDRFTPGDRMKAKLRAKKFVEENYEMLHRGAKVSWEWAYGWGEDPQTEVSALQHAMNFLIEDGAETFETECQCNVTAREDDGSEVKATIKEITNKINRFPRLHCAPETQFITTHIDINKRILTYLTVASPEVFRPSVVDYGTWPKQPGANWEKKSVVNSLSRAYPECSEETEWIYKGLYDLLTFLSERIYYREDGAELTNKLISVDQRWLGDTVQQVIRSHKNRPSLCTYGGVGIKAKTKPFMNRHYGPDCQMHFHCATLPTFDKTLPYLQSDVNFFKTLVHRGIKKGEGENGSLDLFQPQGQDNHLMIARHWTAETPMEDTAVDEGRTIIVWSKPKGDNEWFDNVVGCFANLMKLGCKMTERKNKSKRSYSMQDYIDNQKKKKLVSYERTTDPRN